MTRSPNLELRKEWEQSKRQTIPTWFDAFLYAIIS